MMVKIIFTLAMAVALMSISAQAQWFDLNGEREPYTLDENGAAIPLYPVERQPDPEVPGYRPGFPAYIYGPTPSPAGRVPDYWNAPAFVPYSDTRAWYGADYQ